MAKKTIVNELASAVGTAAGVAAARVEGLKPKRGIAPKHSKAKVAAVGQEAVAAPVAVENSPVFVAHSEIEQLAYLHWEARGGQNGSQEEDWILAERELAARASR
jgi:hypothetical protein